MTTGDARRWLTGWLLLVPVLASAQDLSVATLPPESTVRRHLGFFLRMDIGVGYLQATAGGRDFSGAGLPLGVAVGGAVTENLILGAELWAIATPTPSMNVDGQSGPFQHSSAGVGGVGLNVTHYFMPANVYLSITPSLTVLSAVTYSQSNFYQSYETRAGYGLKLALGKEWWVGDHWGLGIAAEFLLSINRGRDTDPLTWTSFSGGLTFSATFN